MIKEHVREMQRRESQHCQMDFGFWILRVEVFCEFQILKTRFEGKNLIQIMIF